jgi:hypothetical protein
VYVYRVFNASGLIYSLNTVHFIILKIMNAVCFLRILEKINIDAKVISKGKSETPLPFPNSKKNRTCKEIVRV